MGVSRLAWLRVFASDKSGAVSIEFVVLVASLMGVGTLTAVTVQSGALVRAGIIGQGLEEARQLADGSNVPLIFPDIGAGGIVIPGGETPTGGDAGDAIDIVTADGAGGGGGLPGGTADTDECPAALIMPEVGPLECIEQADTDL